MFWYRENDRFPTLAVLRRYLKLSYFFALEAGALSLPVAHDILGKLPFDPVSLPRAFPPVERLIWDFAHPAPQSGTSI